VGLADRDTRRDARGRTRDVGRDRIIDVRDPAEREPAPPPLARERNTAGRDADSPRELPRAGWKAVLARVSTEIKNDHVGLLAAGVAFKGLLALFPAIIAAISIWGLVADPATVQQQITRFTSALPEDTARLIERQLTEVAQTGRGALSFALAASILIALWSASGGLAGLIEGCNAAYDEIDERSFPIKRGLALGLTVGAILFLLVALGLIAVLPALLGGLGLGEVGTLAIRIGQWPLLAALAVVSLGFLYRVAPDRTAPRSRWVSIGAAVATLLWLVGSGLFTVYVERFGSFGQTYGAFAGIIVLMLWLYLTAFVVLLGAEINAEVERQTLRDTTVGDPEAPGKRGAHVADTGPEAYPGRES